MARVIARLNVGGPAIHTTLLSSRLDPERFETRLYTGHVGPGETEMEGLLQEEGVVPVRIPGLGRDVRPGADARAFATLFGELRRFRPHVVHTHTAKAGALGRTAALLARVPVRVHTFHGHVFHGYFGRWQSAAVVATERALARTSTRIVVISDQQRREIVERYRVARPEQVEVVRLGIDLSRVRQASSHRGALRARLGVPAGAPLVVWVGRLVPIKRPDVALAAFATLGSTDGAPAPHLAVFGGGPLEEDVRRQVAALGLGARVHLGGWLDDVAVAYADADAILMTSDNEGTPVTVIEAVASGVPVACTDVGGAEEMLAPPRFGRTAPPGDVGGVASALAGVLGDADLRARARADGPSYMEARHGVARLVREIEALYERLLG